MNKPTPRGVFRPLGWLPLVLLLVAALAAGTAISGWPLMCLMLAVSLAGVKFLVWFQFRTDGGRASPARTLGFLFTWPGMNPREFCDESPLPDPPDRKLFAVAVGEMVLGAALIWGVARWLPAESIWQGLCGCAGWMLFIIFGFFNLLAAAWQAAGVRAQPIMDAPLASKSLIEFWSNRWNRGYRDPAHELILRPLAARCGMLTAMWIVFLLSGLGHEVILSVPAQGGYGLPTAYFLIQALGVTVERSRFGRASGLGRGLAGRLFAFALLLGPLLLLFNPRFLANVMLPMLRASGAI